MRKQRKFRNKYTNLDESNFLRQISFTSLINVFDGKIEFEKSKTVTELPIDVINLLKIGLITEKQTGNQEKNKSKCIGCSGGGRKRKYLTYTRTIRSQLPRFKPGYDHCKVINLNLINIQKEFSENIKVSKNIHNRIQLAQKRLLKTIFEIKLMLVKSMDQIQKKN